MKAKKNTKNSHTTINDISSTPGHNTIGERTKFIFVVADLNGCKLRVPKYVMDKVYNLTSPEAKLLNEYRNKYPSFKIEVFDSIYLEGLGFFSSSLLQM